MAEQDFTGYTEVDPATYLSKTATTVTVAAMIRSTSAFTYFDFTAAFFGGDFTQQGTLIVDSGGDVNAVVGFHCLANSIDNQVNIRAFGGDLIGTFASPGASDFLWSLLEVDSMTDYTDASVALSFDTPYYYDFVGDGSIGSFGQAQLFLYPDSNRTVVIDTLTVLLHTSKKDYRYYYPAQSRGAGGALAMSGSIANVDLDPVEASGAAARNLLLLM